MSHDALIEALSGYVETDEHGTVSFFNNAGAVHRTDGPAVIYSDGNALWYQYGKLHRTDGPALTYAVGTCFWYLQGRELSEEEFEAMTLANKMMSCIRQ